MGDVSEQYLTVIGAGSTVADVISGWADRSPEAPAILSTGRDSVSYLQVFQHLCATRDMLHEMEIGTADRVAIVLPNGLEMALAFLGVSSSAVAAPLNPAYSAAEFDFYFDDLQPRALVVQSGVASRARDAAAARGMPLIEIPVPGVASGLFTYPQRGNATVTPSDFARAPDTALILHTSGTTARPKMVPLTHTNLCLSAQNTAAALELAPVDRCLNVMPLFHVHGLVGALLSSLAAGASVVCAPGFLAPQVLTWMSQFKPSWYTAMPTIHQAIVARAASDNFAPARHPLRFVRSASAPLDSKLLKSLQTIFGVPVVEAYGMTEAAHQVASNPLPPRARKEGSVGLAAGPEVRVADASGSLLAGGESGEIVIRGATVMRAYSGNDEANKGAFFGDWFRTGDTGRIDSDGYIYLAGRIKEIINRGAEKISPAEVEQVLLKHPSVAQAAVFAMPDERLGEDVGAAIVPKSGERVDARALRIFVSQHLADFKVPRAIHIVDAIPVGGTGKIQRARLSQLFSASAIDSVATKTEFVAPRTSREEQLAEIWKEVLDIPRVGVEDDFFAIGGDSILATVLMVRVAELLKRDVAVVDFLEAPTIAGMLAAMDDNETVPDAHGLVPIQPRGSRRPLFCLPPMDGSQLGFARLSGELGGDQPLWGFPLPAPVPGQWSHSIEDVAADHIRAMRTLQPVGPYTIVGDCFGGFVAYEMAVQLRRAGDEVALLVLVDSFLQSGWKSQSPLVARLILRLRHGFRRARYQMQTLRRLAVGERATYLRGRAQAFSDNTRQRTAQAAYNVCVGMRIEPPRFARDPRHANVRAEQRYNPAPYGGRTLLFRTSSPSAAMYPSRLMGWEQVLTGDARTIEVPGDHQSRFLAGAVVAIARTLCPELEGAPPRTPPRVTIGLPVFNGEKYLAQAIESILGQTFGDFELIISDNASTDGTRSICERYACDPRVRYVRSEKNVGAAANFNKVLELATGEYFKWAAHDDVLAPEWLERCVAALDADARVVLCQSAVADIDEFGRVAGTADLTLDQVGASEAHVRFRNLVLVDHDCTDIFGLIRTDSLRRTPRFASYIASDRVLLAELGMLGRFATVSDPLFFLRQHPDRSVRAALYHRRLQWFDPAIKSRQVFPHWRVYAEYFLLVRRVCRSRGERWRCYLHLLNWPWKNWNWARLGSDLVIRVWPGSDAKLTAIGRRLTRKQSVVI